MYEDHETGYPVTSLQEMNSELEITTNTSLDLAEYTDNMDILERCRATVSECTDTPEDEFELGNWCTRGGETVESSEEGGSEEDHISGLASNILAGCGGGSYEMWADFTPPPPDTVLSSSESRSYWSDHDQLTRRDLLIARIKDAVKRTFREARQQLKSGAETGKETRQQQKSESNCDRTDLSTSDSSLILQYPRALTQSNQTSAAPSRSRILELLVKTNPIKNINELEKLADKLSPGKSSKTSKTSISTPQRTKKCSSAPKGDKSSNPFENLYLIKEFVPKAKEVQAKAVPVEHNDLKPIEISTGYNQSPYPLTYQDYLSQQFYFSVDECRTDYSCAEKYDFSNRYYSTDMPSYQTEMPSIQTEIPSYQTDVPSYQTDVPSYQAEAVPIYPETANIAHSTAGNAPAIIPVPPIPEELQSTTPPNLSTIMMLSRLFSSN